MKFLLMNQFFWPDSAATSQLLTDVARRLHDDGHEVDVICGSSGYAAAEEGERPDVQIHRVGSVRFSRGMLDRLLSYANFYALAAWKSLTVRRPDVVLTLTTPPLLSVLGSLVQAVRGSRHVIWEMDMYPDVAVDLAYFRAGGVLDRTVGWIADASRRRADRIIALGECMRDRLMARGVPAGKIAIVHNWADGEAIRPAHKTGHLDKLVVLYSGNLGLAHDIGTIAGAMRRLRSDARFVFMFVGSGGRREELARQSAADGVTSLELRPYVARAGLGQQLAEGDIGLVTQIDSCCGSVVPSKAYGILAAGRPVLFIGPAQSTPARIIRRFGCGWELRCGEDAALAELLQRLANNPQQVLEAGQRARRALEQHFDLPYGTAAIAAELQSVASKAQHQQTLRTDSATGAAAPSSSKIDVASQRNRT
jgi:colanic acid biosynthesis glycosyl transferase WcaI